IERQTPPWDPNDTFDLFDSSGRPLANPDVYIDATQSGYTGYNAERDKGMVVRLKADNTTKLAPSTYQPWAIPGSKGGNDYRWNIANCNTNVMPFGFIMTHGPGKMVGATRQGMVDLIASDPTTNRATARNAVVVQMFPSPMINAIPLVDPEYFLTGKQSGLIAALMAVNFLG